MISSQNKRRGVSRQWLTTEDGTHLVVWVQCRHDSLCGLPYPTAFGESLLHKLNQWVRLRLGRGSASQDRPDTHATRSTE